MSTTQRPCVFCHMETSLDGKIMGRFWAVLDDLDQNPFQEVAFGPNRAWDLQGWISGRVTTDDNFTHYAAPNLPASHEPVRFHVKSVERVGTGGEQLWLRYTVDNG